MLESRTDWGVFTLPKLSSFMFEDRSNTIIKKKNHLHSPQTFLEGNNGLITLKNHKYFPILSIFFFFNLTEKSCCKPRLFSFRIMNRQC